MRTLKTSEAAGLLKVSPNTLRAWENRFGYPKPRRSAGRHRLYVYAEIDALRQALEEGLSISSAISVAVEGFNADAHALLLSLMAFETERADKAMESSLQLRPMERSVEEVLLPALAELRRRRGSRSAVWCFGARWACDWLRRAQRLAPPPDPRVSVLVGDASGLDLDPAAPYVRALELFCARAGARLLSLPVSALDGLAEAAAAAEPNAVVIAGQASGDEEVSRWAYSVRTSVAAFVPVAVYLRPRPPGSGPGRSLLLPSVPSAARDKILAAAEPQQQEATNGGPPTPEYVALEASRA
jgi:DNA-binding transcriptional MerR regulator